jgi:glycolate dehydrogenase FAD-binding subunit
LETTRAVDGFGPLLVETSSSVAELGELVRDAAAEPKAIYPVGGGTMMHLGLPPSKAGIVVDLRGLDRVIDYPARDMTITVEAGITIERLQEVLGAENQWLPVDVPLPEQATLGGAMATNASGPRRYGYGTLRDYVIGISVINDEGKEIKAGGRVVKNVAGYDLMKLYIGSLGTLGIVSQVTLKVKPRPEVSRLLLYQCPSDALARALEILHETHTRPVLIDLMGYAAGKVVHQTVSKGLLAPEDMSWILAIGYEGSVQGVEWQVHQLRDELPNDVAVLAKECDGAQPDGEMATLRDSALQHAFLSFRANMLPSAVASFCREAAGLSPRPILHAHAGSGIVIGHVSADLTRERAATMLTTLTAIATVAHGNLIVTRCPPEWKRDLPVWGRSIGDRVLMRAVKQKLDPHGIFNPGRFVDGI